MSPGGDARNRGDSKQRHTGLVGPSVLSASDPSLTHAQGADHGGLAGLQVIMDEVGRGTATHDGTAIAWAALAHLHNVNRARTLFATHYHEVAERSAALPAAACQQTRIHFGEQVGQHANDRGQRAPSTSLIHPSCACRAGRAGRTGRAGRAHFALPGWLHVHLPGHPGPGGQVLRHPGRPHGRYGTPPVRVPAAPKCISYERLWDARTGLPADVVAMAHQTLQELEAASARARTAATATIIPAPSVPVPTSPSPPVEHVAIQRLRALRVDAVTPRAALDLLYDLKETVT